MPEKPMKDSQPAGGSVADAPGKGTTFSVHGDRVTLVMSRDDFDNLLLALGIAAGAMHAQDEMRRFWFLIALTNRINRDNPEFRQYEIPAEFARSVGNPSPVEASASPASKRIEGFEPPIDIPTEPHIFRRVEGHRLCAACGGGHLHPIHTEYTNAPR